MAERHDLSFELIQAYRSAIYRVLSDPPFELQIDQYSKALDDWQRAAGATQCALLTAANPRSQRCSEAVNQRHHEQLAHQLEPWITVACENCDPKGEWPVEAGFLIAGMNSSSARQLARSYEQNAWLQIEVEATPRLMFVR